MSSSGVPHAIEVERLSKVYRRGSLRGHHYRTLRESISRLVRGDRSDRPAGGDEEFWALKDVSFQAEKGAAIGIVGRNGAGKSTLLKILSRITEPTRGSARLRGRVASLLEVGTGFHPELTGRENVFLNGAILGMSRAEILQRFDDIVAFAEIESFLDTPVKRYSSGMYVRLAFAVAAHLSPEILIVDEVLAVGDAAFQKKCLGKMTDVTARQGLTILFVSHNMAAVEKLCRTALLLEGGRLAQIGAASDVIRTYLRSDELAQLEWERPEPALDRPHVARLRLCDTDGRTLTQVLSDTVVRLEIDVVMTEDDDEMRLGVLLHDGLGTPILSTSPTDDGTDSPITAGRYRYAVTLPGPILMPQDYSVSVTLYARRQHVDHLPNVLSFPVTEVACLANSAGGDLRPGLLQILCRWSCAVDRYDMISA